MSSLKEQIQEQMKSAMKAKDSQRLSAIRLITAAIKQIEVDERVEPDDTRVLAILDKMIKQRKDSISQYQQANRQDLVDKEQYEVKLIQEFMPSPLSENEIDELIVKAMRESGAQSMRDMPRVIALLKPQVQGRADLGKISAKIKNKLT